MRPTNSPYRIAVLGIGAVGGYLGALLSDAALKQDIEVIFICRGENLKAIGSKGLRLITDSGEKIFKPDLATDIPGIIGKVDLLLCCVKGFDLEDSLQNLASCISDETIIIPILNGISASDTIKENYPNAKVWKGAIYLFSKLIAPGVIRQSGPLNQLIFGSDKAPESELAFVEGIFLNAGINAQAAKDIDQKLWEKFFFISALATITSYYNCTIGEVQADPLCMQHLNGLLMELQLVAVAGRILVSADLPEKTFARIKGLPPETTSSMLTDIRKGGKTEIEELTGYVVRLAKSLHIAVPVYDMMYTKLG